MLWIRRGRIFGDDFQYASLVHDEFREFHRRGDQQQITVDFDRGGGVHGDEVTPPWDVITPLVTVACTRSSG